MSICIIYNKLNIKTCIQREKAEVIGSSQFRIEATTIIPLQSHCKYHMTTAVKQVQLKCHAYLRTTKALPKLAHPNSIGAVFNTPTQMSFLKLLWLTTQPIVLVTKVGKKLKVFNQNQTTLWLLFHYQSSSTLIAFPLDPPQPCLLEANEFFATRIATKRL